MSTIHPTAIIESGAELGEDVEVGAYAYLGAHVRIGDRCRLHHHAVVEGNTILGEECEVFPFAYVGGKTQDLKYLSGLPLLRIGRRNVFREFCSVHGATKDETATVIGDDNHVLAYAHIAHECCLGDQIIVSSGALLGGHVEVDAFANIGGGAAIHQFCKVGKYAMLAGASALVGDLQPFMIAEGNRARVRGYNHVLLERRGWSESQIRQVRKIFKLFYMSRLNRSQAFQEIMEDESIDATIKDELRSFRERSSRSLV